ncbi:uncharacterized protein PHALS_11859 [Plasmopara halstedii]|uniref:Uncharacterized protein n=1 Tax=Plasmopara halstedii TaxID=4781 RepID=A0A0P1AKA0_PLAHL|nr:uncharacterized protein PHALS_11859 [Plasmopara halstedii]CEG41518.1 hypothetical protein PHALS_11859 [Plasmopara halstedii]|eukprot:XP_024577887.1 hypothetical protein PHALS_11859 [Plasmopara halstedii]
MLKQPKSQNSVRDEWVEEKFSVVHAYEVFAKREETKAGFYRSDMGSLWLSYAGYCWKHDLTKSTWQESSPETVLKELQTSGLNEDEVVKLVVGAKDYVGGQEAIAEIHMRLLKDPETKHLAERIKPELAKLEQAKTEISASDAQMLRAK